MGSLRLGSGFLNKVQEAYKKKEKMDTLKLIKIKNVFYHFRKQKEKSHGKREMFVMHITAKYKHPEYIFKF